MNGSYAVFEIFNRIESFIWFGAAAILPLLTKADSKQQRWAVIAASISFILFGITDLLEAATQGQMPVWLWCAKAACAALLLACRHTYLGWKNFRITDRWFVFAMICLAVYLAIYLGGHLAVDSG